jgi:hypothetical protein
MKWLLILLAIGCTPVGFKAGDCIRWSGYGEDPRCYTKILSIGVKGAVVDWCVGDARYLNDRISAFEFDRGDWEKCTCAKECEGK